MTLRIHAALAAAFLILGGWASPAAAQPASTLPERSLAPAVFPRWDLSGSMGMLNTSRDELGRSQWRGWDQKFEYRVDLGRYWTTHFRTEVSAGTSNGWDEVEVTPLPPAGGLAPIYTYTDIERRLFTVAPAATWQFGENAFLHPYVTAGVKIGLLQEHRFREPERYRFDPLRPPPPALDERTASVLARPFLAGGFKSYVSRAVFVRTEGRLALGPAGVQQVSLLAGVGVDF